MPATKIETIYGEDVHRDFAVYGPEINPDTDVALFTVRDRDEKVLYWDAIKPDFSDDLQAYVFTVQISHIASELIPKGTHKYGLTLYRNAILENGYPVDGDVLTPIARKPYIVKEAVAREEGLS